MFIEVILDMKNPNALSTVGMLSALLESGSNDYTDLISPFILASVPNSIGQVVDISVVQKNMQSEYGFEDMPRNFIRGVLQRYTKDDGYFKKENDQYYVVTLFNRSDIVNKQKKMRENIDYVLRKMQDYFSNNYVFERLSEKQLKEMLEKFFQSCGFEMARNINSLQEISARSHGKEIFWIARYVLDITGKHLLEEDYLLEMVKGFLICKALYYFEHGNKISFNSKLRNVTCYLDCSLVISILGYNSEEREREALELYHLLKKNGGRICVFEHTVTEAELLLDAFARHPDRINAFQLDGLASKGYPSEILLVIASSVKEKLKEDLGIDTIPNPDYSGENYIGIQGEAEISKWLEDTRSNHNGNRHFSRERFDYDAKSLSSIGMIRRGVHPNRIERCKAILITQDPFLSCCMKHLYPNEFPPEVDYAILDVDIASLLWLNNYNKESTLPIDILISNAVSLNIATPEIMERAFELTEQLLESGEITEDAALVIRSQPCIKKHLNESIQNDISALSSDSIRDALNRYIKSESDKRVNEITLQYEKKLNLEKAKNKKREDERQKRLDECNSRATRTADTIAEVLKKIWLAVNAFILFSSVIIWGLKTFTDYSLLESNAWKWVFIVLDILSLLQIIDYMKNQNSFAKKIILKLRDFIFTYYYNFLIGKFENTWKIR